MHCTCDRLHCYLDAVVNSYFDSDAHLHWTISRYEICPTQFTRNGEVHGPFTDCIQLRTDSEEACVSVVGAKGGALFVRGCVNNEGKE